MASSPNELAYQVASEAGDLDPVVNILVRRMTLLRRALARLIDMQPKIGQILEIYSSINTPGPFEAMHNGKQSKVAIMHNRPLAAKSPPCRRLCVA